MKIRPPPFKRTSFSSAAKIASSMPKCLNGSFMTSTSKSPSNSSFISASTLRVLTMILSSVIEFAAIYSKRGLALAYNRHGAASIRALARTASYILRNSTISSVISSGSASAAAVRIIHPSCPTVFSITK